MASHPIYQFYAELDEYPPGLWRRFQVPGNISMSRLAYILMTLFEMRATHLFSFDVPHKKNYRNGLLTKMSAKEADELLKMLAAPERAIVELPSEEEPFVFPGQKPIKAQDATRTQVSQIFNYAGDYLKFWYDFGDDWWIMVKLEDIITDAALSGRELPRVLEGVGFGIFEDCGGASGLADIHETAKNKKSKQYREICEWQDVEQLPDLDVLDVADMNFRLKKLPRIFKEIYEDGLYPTKQSIKLIEREYAKPPTT